MFVPLVRAYFGYGFESHTTWLASSRQWELNIGPGILAFLGGLGLLIPSCPRTWLPAC